MAMACNSRQILVYQPFFVELEREECFQRAHDGVDGEVQEEHPVEEGEAGPVHQVEPPRDHGGQDHPAVAARLRQGHHHILRGEGKSFKEKQQICDLQPISQTNTYHIHVADLDNSLD